MNVNLLYIVTTVSQISLKMAKYNTGHVQIKD